MQTVISSESSRNEMKEERDDNERSANVDLGTRVEEYASKEETETSESKSAADKKLILFVRSQRKCVSERVTKVPIFESGFWSTNVALRVERVLVYDNVFDEAQKEALENASSLAKSLGLALEVRDLARHGLFGWLLGLSGKGRFAVRTPSISLPGRMLKQLEVEGRPHVIDERISITYE